MFLVIFSVSLLAIASGQVQSQHSSLTMDDFINLCEQKIIADNQVDLRFGIQQVQLPTKQISKSNMDDYMNELGITGCPMSVYLRLGTPLDKIPIYAEEAEHEWKCYNAIVSKRLRDFVDFRLSYDLNRRSRKPWEESEEDTERIERLIMMNSLLKPSSDEADDQQQIGQVQRHLERCNERIIQAASVESIQSFVDWIMADSEWSDFDAILKVQKEKRDSGLIKQMYRKMNWNRQ